MRLSLHLVQEAPPAPPRDDGAVDAARDRWLALVARKPAAERWLVETHSRLIERVLYRILGDASGLEDLVQEVFVRVFARVADVEDPGALKSFVTSVAVFVARERIRSKRRSRWLAFFASEDVPAQAVQDDTEARMGVRAFYAALDALDVDDRLAFTLRIVEGLPLVDVAAACNVSLATAKRRVRRAEEAFVKRAKQDEILARWLEEGERWT